MPSEGSKGLHRAFCADKAIRAALHMLWKPHQRVTSLKAKAFEVDCGRNPASLLFFGPAKPNWSKSPFDEGSVFVLGMV